MVILLAFLLLLIGACTFAFSRGGPSEQAAALVVALGAILSPLAAHTGHRVWQGSEVGIFVVDGAMLAAFIAIMLRSNRFWPIWTTAFQLLTVAAHLGPLVRLVDLAIPFALEEQIWAWIILVQLILVTWLNRGSRPKTRTRL